MWHFEDLPSLAPDPIFAITAQAKAAGSQAINGTIGVIMDEQGSVVVFPSVQKALKDLGAAMQTYDTSYPPLLGLPTFREAVHALVLPHLPPHRIASIASTAGTGALALNLRLLTLFHPQATVMLPVPAWVNHLPVCEASGLQVLAVPCLGKDGLPSTGSLTAAIEQATGPVAVLLQVGCHNPTGLDFSKEQWEALADCLAHCGQLALLDFAYQGFGGEPEEDAKIITLFTDREVPTLIAWSASKNHAIYGLRCGCALAVTPDEEMQKKVEVNFSRVTRGMHSAAPTFGQSVVARVQQAYSSEWRADLRACRTVLQQKRSLLQQALPKHFSPSLAGRGMFAMLPLTVTQIQKLRKDHAVYLTDDGRINIAGIPFDRIDRLCAAVIDVAGERV